MTTPVVEILDRLQKKEASSRAAAGTSPGLDTLGHPGSPVSRGASAGALEDETQERALSRLQGAIQAIEAAYPADFSGVIPPETLTILNTAQDRMDHAFQAGDYTKAEAALEIWGRLWLDTIKKHGGQN